ncbi:hypothetical protein KIPB_008562, partial [Kipferlia bialata]|eukprot:g8562.t1
MDNSPEVTVTRVLNLPEPLGLNPTVERGVRYGPELDRGGRPVRWLPYLPRARQGDWDPFGVTSIGLDRVLFL